MNETMIKQMKTLGMTEYEVKAYLSLLKQHPLNGYALSKHSGIPRSRIYEVLDGLKKKAIVFEYSGENSSIYEPIEPHLLIQKLKLDFESVIDSVEAFTHQLYQANELDMEPKTLKGYNNIMSVIKALIKDAKHRISLSIWHEELVAIQSDIDNALNKGIILKGIYFGNLNPYKDLVSHRRIERYIAEKKERFLILIIDNKHVVSGIISRGEDTSVTWSKDPGIVDINDDLIIHDVMLNTYNTFLKGSELANYEHTLDLVRKNYYGFSDERFELFPLPKED